MMGWIRNLLKSDVTDVSLSRETSVTTATAEGHIFTKAEILEMAHRAIEEQLRQNREYEENRHLEPDYRLAEAIDAVFIRGQKTAVHIRELQRHRDICAFWASVKAGGHSAIEEERKRIRDAKTAMRRSDIPLIRHQSKDQCRVVQTLLPTYRAWGIMLIDAGAVSEAVRHSHTSL